MAREEEFYVKASCDFIAAVIFDQVEMLVGIECKARVAPATIQQEHDVEASIQRSHRAFLGTELYTIVEAASIELLIMLSRHTKQSSLSIRHTFIILNVCCF